MMFYSILFPSMEDEARAGNHPWLTFRTDDKKCDKYTVHGNKIVLASRERKPDGPMRPGLYLDLNMDQIMDEVLCHETDEDLREYFYHICPDASMAHYRQDVMKALEKNDTGSAFRTFLQTMAKAERLLTYGRQAHHTVQRDKYTVDGAALYCASIRQLLLRASELQILSNGLLSFLDMVRIYVNDARFIILEEQTRQVKNTLEQIAYSLRIKDGLLYVDFDADTADYVKDIHQDFDTKARWGSEAEVSRLEILPFRQMELSPLEVLIMKALMEKHPKAFQDAHKAAQEAQSLPEPFIGRFVKEIRFYFLYLDLMVKLRGKGCPFAYPEITGDGNIKILGAYDLALAISTDAVVPNDFILSEGERSAVITGANQGGKTTYARSIGQVAVLAVLGLPVPCESARLPLYSAIFSQFTQAEDAAVDNGKLKEELLRLRPILRSAGKSSLVILNELFSSATAQDAQDMADRTLTLLMEAGAHVVCVTHIDGLCLNHAVSMVAQVQETSGQRLYKIIRAEADGQAYANEIAQRHHLSFAQIKERITHGI
jgi:DNA mismatch repair protein MutS